MGKDIAGKGGDGDGKRALRRVEDALPPSGRAKAEAKVEIYLRGDESAFDEKDHRGKVLAVFAAVSLFLCSVSLFFPRGGPVRLRERILLASTTADLNRYRRWAEDRPALKHLVEVKGFVLRVCDAQLDKISRDLVSDDARPLQQADSKGLGLLLDELTGTGTNASRIETRPGEEIQALLGTLKNLQQVVDDEKALEPQMAPLRDLRERIFIALLAQPSKQTTSRAALGESRELARDLPLLGRLADEVRDPWAFLNVLARDYRSKESLVRLTVWPAITVGEVLERGILEEPLDGLGGGDRQRLEAVDAFLRAGSIPEQIKALGDLEEGIRGRTELVDCYRVRLARRITRAAIPPAFAPNEKAYEDARAWWNAYKGELVQVALEAGIEGSEEAADKVTLAFSEGRSFAQRMQRVAYDAGNELRRAFEENGGEGPSWEKLRQELDEAKPEGDGAQVQLEQTEALLDLASGSGMQVVRWIREPETLSEGSARAAKLELVRWLAKRLDDHEQSKRILWWNKDMTFDCKALGCSITFGCNRVEDVKKVDKGVKNADWSKLESLAATDLLQQIGSAIWLAYVQCQRDRAALDTGWFGEPSLRHIPIAETVLSGPKEIAACSLLNEMPLLFEPANQETWFQRHKERGDSLPVVIRMLADRCDVVEHEDFVGRFGISPLYHGTLFRSADRFRERATAEFKKGPSGLKERLDELAGRCFRDSRHVLQTDEVEHLFQLARAEAFLRCCIQNRWYPAQEDQKLGPYDLRGEEWETAVHDLVPDRLIVNRRSDIVDPAGLLGGLGPAGEALSDEGVLDGSTLSFRELAQLILAERAYLGRHYELNLGDKGPFGSRLVNERYERVWQRTSTPFRDVFPGLPGLP